MASSTTLKPESDRKFSLPQDLTAETGCTDLSDQASWQLKNEIPCIIS